MATVPKRLVDKVGFFAAHVAPFAANAAEIGLSVGEVDELQLRVDAARTAFARQRAAQNEARAATLGFNLAVDALAAFGGNLLSKVRAHARPADGTDVYELAQIRPRAKRSPVGAPGKPYALSTRLGDNGSLALAWACDNPRGSMGTIYRVRRRIGGDGTFEFLGTPGERRFVDATVPAGATALTYEIQAVRSTRTGHPATFNVNFGANDHRVAPAILRSRAA